jgi:hypothetical protein
MAGAMAGALLGWLYWSRVGCTSTHCPLVSNPWITTLYGSLLFATLSSEISKMFNAKKQNP